MLKAKLHFKKKNHLYTNIKLSFFWSSDPAIFGPILKHMNKIKMSTLYDCMGGLNMVLKRSHKVNRAKNHRLGFYTVVRMSSFIETL